MMLSLVRAVVSVMAWFALASIFDCAHHRIAVLAIPSSSSSSIGVTSAKRHNFWFSFGDSYTSTGFNPSGTLPSVGNPLGNPPYPGRTATGGPNWVDYLTTTYNKSLVLTYNLAYDGATIDSKLVKPYLPTVKSLVDQVNEFITLFANKPHSQAPWESQDTLFSIWIGINDIGNSYDMGGNRDEFNDVLLGAYFYLVEKLYNAGARNFFFLNVPPINRSPSMLAQNASARAIEKRAIADYNRKLLRRVSDLKRNHDDIRTWLWDSNAAFTTILDNPANYGFQDATSYGPNPAYFWGNNYHPGRLANNIFANEIGQLLRGNSIFLADGG